jgi:hypothetical protein
LDEPFESETEIEKSKLPVALGVPEMVPVAGPNCVPEGNLPDGSEK